MAEPHGFIEPEGRLGELASGYLNRLLRGDRNGAASLVLEAVERDGVPVRDIYLGVFQPAQYEVGRLWQQNRISVAHEHFCTAAAQQIMSRLYPHIFSMERTGRTMVAACVGGELHELGMRMVADFFEMEGWDTYFLGASTPDEDVARAVAEREADLLGVSVTMSYHLHLARRLVSVVRDKPECGGVKVMVGGYPFLLDDELWKWTGADGWAPDAAKAVHEAERLLT
ncbi:cobalamin B12-binding domain-containing protein [Desulfohalovibrio reitneri]|uniref:cobalamin B12-binding domain-containing protein n=1 Tax=Desulfohalovibrio reitneri TaxID=1307759 RepID=UPI00068AB11D|nr:cobalamin-dependent protein [Desulfohalovibrio reitneri]